MKSLLRFVLFLVYFRRKSWPSNKSLSKLCLKGSLVELFEFFSESVDVYQQCFEFAVTVWRNWLTEVCDRLYTLESGIDVALGISVAPLLKMFISEFKFIFTSIKALLIFLFFFFKIFQKWSSKPSPTFIPISRVHV